MFALPVNSSEKNIHIVELKELLRIEDSGMDFYFKYPDAPLIDNRGAMYVLDDKQLLKFDKSGKFIENYLKEGLGPGEANSSREVIIQGDYFILYNLHPSKFLWFDQTDGTLKKEIRLSDKLGYSNFLSYYNNKYFFIREAFPRTRNKAVFVDIKVKLLSYNLDSKTFADENLFYLKKYFLSISDNHSSVKNVNFVQICKINEHTILIANTGNYEVQRLDLNKMKLSPFIKREYKKVLVKKEWEKHFHTFRFSHTGIKGKEFKTWIKQNLDDIQKIYTFGSKIWIVTSTFDETTRLVNTDVFDFNGKYIDTFLLKLPEKMLLCRINISQMRLHKNHLFIIEQNDDGDFELAKYRLINIPGWAK